MDCDTVVVVVSARADKLPTTFLLFKIQTGGVGQKKKGDEHARKTEPGDEVKLGLDANVVIQHGREQGTTLSASGADTVGCGADGGGVDFGSDKERDGVGTELGEEGGEKVHRLKCFDTRKGLVVGEVEGGYNEKDEDHEEAD